MRPISRRIAIAAALLVVLLLLASPPPLRCPPPDAGALDRLHACAPAVQLWASPIDFLGGRAIHPHFIYTRAGEAVVHRAEVWQTAAGPLDHVWIDRISPLHDQRLGLCLLGERAGPDAEAVIAQLDRAAEGGYRWSGLYLPAPGPNSNTFAAAILSASGWDVVFPRQAIGAWFPGPHWR
jgi:hypothetical protein